MTGRYLIYTPAESAPDEKVFDAVWRRFGWVCRPYTAIDSPMMSSST
jgi:hypothetical protein